MDDVDLLKQITEIVNKAKENGVKVEVTETADRFTYILSDKKLTKAVILGKVKINKIELVVGYAINLIKWNWAMDEGFTRDQIVEEMPNDIFSHISTNKIAKYFNSC